MDWRTKFSRRGTTESEDEVVSWERSRSRREGEGEEMSMRKGRKTKADPVTEMGYKACCFGRLGSGWNVLRTVSYLFDLEFVGVVAK